LEQKDIGNASEMLRISSGDLMRTKQKLFIENLCYGKDTRGKTGGKKVSNLLIEGENDRNPFELGGEDLAHVLICVICKITECARVEVPLRVSRRLAENDGTVVIAEVQPSDLAVDAVLSDGA
jgi:hypothetical protein